VNHPNIYHTPITRHSLFLLKVLLNTSQPTNLELLAGKMCKGLVTVDVVLKSWSLANSGCDWCKFWHAPKSYSKHLFLL